MRALFESRGMAMSRHFGWLAVVATTTGIAACTRMDPEWCDGERPGCHCDVDQRRCVSPQVDLDHLDDMAVEAPDLSAPPCRGADECPMAEKPACNMGTCGPCGGGVDCARFGAKPVCALGICVECAAAADCAAKQKTCNLMTATCVPCKKHEECVSGFCDVANGTCAAVDDVYFVDNQNMTPGDCTMAGKNGDGSRDKPFCDISLALAAPVRQFILVAPQPDDYGPIAITSTDSKPVTILSTTRLGAGIGTNAGTVPAVAVTGGMSAVSVTVDGFRMESVLLGATDVVTCRGGATLTLKNSRVERGGENGVHSSGCTLTMDSVAVIGHGASGISLDGKDTYKITNCFVINNTASGVKLDVQATGQFAFNTVAANLGLLGGGITCLGTQTIESSVVSRNNQKMGTQFVGCTLKNVVTGPDGAPGAEMNAPKFTPCAPQFGAMIEFCLTMDSPGIDQRDAAMGTLTDHDYFGSARPKNGMYDVGAQEVR